MGKILTVLKVNFGNIQPGATAWSEQFYVGARKWVEIKLFGYIYGDNLPQPEQVSFLMTIDVNTRNLDMRELE